MELLLRVLVVFEGSCDHRDLHGLTHSFPTRRSPDRLHRVLTRKPNQYQTDVEFWESMALNLAISGNAYAIIQRLGDEIVGLLPVSSSQVETTLLDEIGRAHV